MQFLMAACGVAHMRQIARALQDRSSLAGLWLTGKNDCGIDPSKYRRAWIFHLAMKPFYQFASAAIIEKVHHKCWPLWRFWIRRQNPPPFDVAYGMLCYATEPFEIAERTGALKLLDATSSHPTTAYGYWQRECDLWCPGAEPGVPRWLFARGNREVERADIILCPSTFVRDTMIYNGVPEAKCVINPYGVDTSKFTPRTALPEQPRFLCVGAIGLRKGHQYLFRAFEKVKRQLPNTELNVVGNLFHDFRLEWPRWQGTFNHHENIPWQQLAELLRGATAFVFPSNEEGFAKAVIEGMASGLPIIATHESGATTLVRDGVEGLIVRSRDIDQLAQAMITLATDRQMNERMGKAAFLRGGKDNTWGDFAQRLIGLSEEAIAKRNGRRSPIAGN